jgi:hypothetical protein
MKNGEIILLRCPDRRVAPVLVIGKKAKKIIGLQVQSYREEINAPQKASKPSMVSYKQRQQEKKLKKEKNKKVDMKSVVIGKPEGLRYNSIVKVNREVVIEIDAIIASIAHIDKKLFSEVLDKYKDFKRKQAMHKELHSLKQKILLCQMNNERYDVYEKRLTQIIEELDFPEIHSSNNHRQYMGFRQAPTKGYIKVYNGGR